MKTQLDLSFPRKLFDYNSLNLLPLDDAIELANKHKEFNIESYWKNNPAGREQSKRLAEQWFKTCTSYRNSKSKINWFHYYQQFQHALYSIEEFEQLPHWIKSEDFHFYKGNKNKRQQEIIFQIRQGHINEVFIAWLAGANINPVGQKPLFEAVIHNQFHIVKWLFYKGANPSVQELKELIHLAIDSKMLELLKEKLVKKANLTTESPQVALSSLFPDLKKNLNTDVEKQIIQFSHLNTLAKLQATSKAFRDNKAIKDQMQKEARVWFERYMPELAKKLIALNEQDWITKRKVIQFALDLRKKRARLKLPTITSADLNLAWLPTILGKDPFVSIDSNSLNERLVDAAKQNDTEKMIYLIIAGAWPSEYAPDYYRFVSQNNSPLHTAAKFGHLNAVSLLLEQGVSSGLVNDEKRTIFDVASCFGHVDLMKFLIGKPGCSPVINYHDSWHSRPPICYAVEHGQTEAVKYLVQQGARINSKDHLGRTPLHIASNNANMINLLIENGATPSVNIKDKWDFTPLHYAASYGNVDSVRALLKAGARIDIKNWDGDTPLLVAADPQVINLLTVAQLTKELKNKSSEWSFNPIKIFLDPTLKNEKKEIFKQLNEKIKEASDNHTGQTVNAVINNFLDTNKKSKLHEHRNFFFSKERPAEEQTTSEKFIDAIKSKYGTSIL